MEKPVQDDERHAIVEQDNEPQIEEEKVQRPASQREQVQQIVENVLHPEPAQHAQIAPLDSLKDDKQLGLEADSGEALEVNAKLQLGLTAAANTLRNNLPLEALGGNSKIIAMESASYLWASGLWDLMMKDALDFRTRAESSAHQLQSGIHANAPMIWHNLPLEENNE